MNGSPASIGDPVPPGAVITTGSDSLCQVVFNAKNIVHIAAGTTLRFDATVSRGATLQKGAVAMVLRKLAAAQGDELRFSISTSNTVAGVRGTCFFIDVEDQDHTYVCACNGSIHLESADGKVTRNISSSHHQEVRVTRAGAGESVSSAPLLYHTDADVEAIAARIGEKIDWTKIDQ